MDKRKIQEFHQKLTDERLHNHQRHESQIKILYSEIISAMAVDYTHYRENVPSLLQSLENNSDNSIAYSIDLFFELYDKFLGSGNFSALDISIMDHNPDQDTFKLIEDILANSSTVKQKQRLSENNFDLSKLSIENKKKISTWIIRKIQKDAKNLDWKEDLVLPNMVLSALLRQILLSLGKVELLYHTMGLILDRLSSSGLNQTGRDFAEEIILSSFKDGIAEMGLFDSFRMYSNIGNIHAALIYINLSLTRILRKHSPYSERFAMEVIWQSLKFFRNVHLHGFAIRIYKQVPMSINFPPYEQRSMDHSYFSTLLLMHDPALPSLLLDYLRKERENLLQGGINDATPWLLTLYNIIKVYPAADFSPAGLGFFLSIFETIVPKENVKKYKDIILAESPDLKKHLKEALVKLNETRNTADFVYDNDSGIMISNRLIDYSSKIKDASSFLLSMVLKSDYSILFQEKKSAELLPLIIPDINVDELETLYDNTDELLSDLSLDSGTSMCWLAVTERDYMTQLQLYNNKFSFHRSQEWKYDKFKELLDMDYFASLEFDDTKKSRSGHILQISPEEFEAEENKIIQDLKIGKLSIDSKADEIYIVKDMELSRFPHNLFLDSMGNLLAKSKPVTNVLSTEWLIEKDKTKKLPSDYKKSVWIPTESEDNELYYLFSNIEDTIKEHSFEIYQNMVLNQPLSSDINIVCSHGLKNISETQIVSHENHHTYNLNNIIGNGKILIFFVCHSGSMKAEFFRNNVTSLIKRFIAQGYEAVIAPFWALDVRVPKYWLPEFLKSFDEGQTISRAMFNANRKVFDQYPTPAAWACLHLYGNPNLSKDHN